MFTQDTVLKSLHFGLQRLIFEKGWTSGLSEIQLQSIPRVLAGHDCIIEAPTAGGKTEAVLFPTLTRAAGKKKKSVQILYLAPLRALLNDIEKRVEEYAIACGLHSFKWHGDVDQEKKIKEFSAPSQLLLTTPESLEAILLRKAGWIKFFSGLEVVICDEAHNFAAGDRGGHLVSLLERLEKAIGNRFQRIALTATVGNPGVMLQWLAGTNRQPGQRVHAASRGPVQKDYRVQFFDKILDDVLPPEKQSRIREFNALYEMLPHKKSIVFGGSRAGTEDWASKIGKMNERINPRNPVKVRTHHSSVSKYYREEAEGLIKEASESGLDAIISTSTLELGIDIGQLDQVIQAGVITSPSAFLQRVGRTGRRRGRMQCFRGFCTFRKDLVLLTAVVKLGLRHEAESLHIARRAFHLAAHQLICLCLQNRGIRPGEAWSILSSAYCFSHISADEFQELIEFMLEKKYLRDVDGALVVGEETERVFLGSNWRRLFAVFESAPMFEVWEGKKQVGTLDSSFVEGITVPFLFMLGGIEWKAEKINMQRRQVIAKRTRVGDAPRWSVFMGGDVPLETAKEVGRLLFGDDMLDFLDDEGREGIAAARGEVRGIGWRDGKWIIAVPETSKGKAYIWTFAGDRINRTLALLLESSGIGKAVANYKYVEVKSAEKFDKLLPGKIEWLLAYYKQPALAESSKESLPDSGAHGFSIPDYSKDVLSGSQVAGKRAEEVMRETRRRFEFSKFSKCLPDDLWAAAMEERTMDLEGLKRELEKSIVSFI